MKKSATSENCLVSVASVTRLAILALAAATTFLAMYVASGAFFPFITGKAFIFRTLVELMLLLYIPLAVAVPAYRPTKNIGLIAYGIFIAILLAADLLGVSVSNSLGSNFERMEGFVTHIHLFALTVILVSLRVTTVEWKRLLQVHLAASVLVLFAAFGEYFKILADLAAGKSVALRLSSTLGNSAYLSIYCAFNIFFAGILALQTKHADILSKILYGILAAMHLFILWQTQTRGTVLGLVAGLALGLLWYLWKKRDNTKMRNILLAVFAVGILLLGLFMVSKDSAFVQNNPTLKRLAAIELGEQTVRSRVMIWQMSFEGVKERPLLGWGQDNFVYVFAKHYNPEMFDQEQWFDRSHNVFFDWLIAAGILGLFAYLSLYGVLLYTIVRNAVGRFSDGEQAILIGLLATYFVHNVIVFDNLVSYISFFLLFAYVMSMKTEAVKIEYIQSKSKIWAAGIISVLLCTIIYINVVYKPQMLNKAIFRMFNFGQNITLEEVRQTALGMTMSTLYGNPEANEQLLTLLGFVIKSNASDEDKKYFYDLIKGRFDTEIAQDSQNPRQPTLLASTLASYGLYDEAIKYYDIALTRTPSKTMLWAELAQVHVANGDIKQAEKAARTAHTLSARSIQSAAVLANILYDQKSYDEVRVVWKETIARNKNSQESMLAEISLYNEKKDQTMLAAAEARFLEVYPQFAKELEGSLQKKSVK